MFAKQKENTHLLFHSFTHFSNGCDSGRDADANRRWRSGSGPDFSSSPFATILTIVCMKRTGAAPASRYCSSPQTADKNDSCANTRANDFAQSFCCDWITSKCAFPLKQKKNKNRKRERKMKKTNRKKNCKETQNNANIHCEINERSAITVVLAACEKHMEKLKAVCWCHGIVCSEFCPLNAHRLLRPNRMTEKSDILRCKCTERTLTYRRSSHVVCRRPRPRRCPFNSYWKQKLKLKINKAPTKRL